MNSGQTKGKHLQPKMKGLRVRRVAIQALVPPHVKKAMQKDAALRRMTVSALVAAVLCRVYDTNPKTGWSGIMKDL